jgi:excisionase family DNA binding protein
MDSPYLTTAEVARYLRVDAQTVRRWATEGELHAMRAGKLLRFHRDEIERFTTAGRTDQPA